MKLLSYGANYPDWMNTATAIQMGIEDREECEECLDSDTDQGDCPHDNEDGHDFDDFATED